LIRKHHSQIVSKPLPVPKAGTALILSPKIHRAAGVQSIRLCYKPHQDALMGAFLWGLIA